MSRIAIVHFVNYKKGTQSRATMRGVMLYVMQARKTVWEGQRLVRGINCQPQSVYDDLMEAKNFGAAIGLIAGTAMALKEQMDKQNQQEQEIPLTMEGM